MPLPIGIIGAVINGAVNLMEVVVTGRSQGSTKKELGLSIAHTVLQELAKNQIVPAVPPKEELADVVDSVVAVKNAEGWGKVPAAAQVVFEIDDLVNIFKAGIEAAAALNKPKPQV